jgi:hypothetical protein
VFAIIGAGAFAGALLRKTLPNEHLADDASILSLCGLALS